MIEETIKFIILSFAYYVLFISYENIFKKNIKMNSKNILLIGVVTIVNIIGSNSHHSIKLLISILTFFTISKIGYNESIKRSVLMTLVIFSIVIISELILMIPITVMVSDVNEYVNNINIFKALLTLCTTLLTYVILNIVNVKNVILQFFGYLNNKHTAINYSILIELTLSILLIKYLNVFASDKHMSITIIFSVFCLFVIAFTMYFIYTNNKLKTVNKFLLDNEKYYQEIFTINKQFRHNIIHELNCIKIYGNEEVCNLVDKYIEEHKMVNSKKIDSMKIPSGLQGILYQKIILKDAINVDIQIDNYFKTEPFDTLGTMNIVRLSESFGIVLDNAFEAAMDENIKNKFVYIFLYEENDKYVIKVTNPVRNLMDIDNLVGNSTKINHMGEGLNYLYKKSKFDVKTSIRNDLFTVEMKIKK